MEIIKSEIIHAKDLEGVLKDYQAAMYERTSARDVWGALKSQFQLGDIIRYCTVPLNSGDFVLITVANGKKHILSPVETATLNTRLSF